MSNEYIKDPEVVLSTVREFYELEEDPIFIEYGKKFLKPVKPKNPFVLHPTIEPLFLETMQTMGYQ